jgi:hypothetical protein
MLMSIELNGMELFVKFYPYIYLWQDVLLGILMVSI